MQPPCGVPAKGPPWREADETLPLGANTTRTLALPETPVQPLAAVAAAVSAVLAALRSNSLFAGGVGD